MRQSALFTKTRKEAPKDEVSTNAQLLMRSSFVDKLTAGVYSYLPLGLRVLNNIEAIIRDEMNRAGGVEILMPALQPKELWTMTGRWDSIDVLFKLIGSGEKEYALGATHEEVITPLLSQFALSYKNLPQAVYQIQTKFRNEARAKSGLLRGREFRMKDLYSFHKDERDLDAYYETMKTAYTSIYERCGIGDFTYLTFASGGAFSRYSHEFQMLTEAGEDIIYLCESCRVAVNKEILADQLTCPKCNSERLAEKKAIEVGNIFKLMTRFSEAFKLIFTDEFGKEQPVIMGTYGIGSSRLMGAIVEAHHDERGIIWPKEIAPFYIHLVHIGKEEATRLAAERFYADLKKQAIAVLYDDRLDVRAGEKFADSDLLGLPVRCVISDRTVSQGQVEIKKRTNGAVTMLPLTHGLSDYV